MGKEPARRRLRRVEGFTTTEVPDDEKPPLLRVFLARRARETQGHFAAGPEATDAGFRDLSPEHPLPRAPRLRDAELGRAWCHEITSA